MKTLQLKYDFKNNLTLENYNKIKDELPKSHIINLKIGKSEYNFDI